MRPRIALVHGNRLNVGGVEQHVLGLMQRGDAAQFDWLVLSATSPEFAARADAAGAAVVDWEPAHGADTRALARLVAELRSRRVDLVHAHSPRATALALMAARLLGVPAVITVHIPSYYMVHGSDRRANLKRRAYQAAERWLNRCLADRLIYVSEYVYREARQLGLAPSHRSRVIPNGVDLTSTDGSNHPSSLRAKLRTAPSTTVIVSVGRLSGQKGFDVLLTALARLQSRDIEVWLVGDGPLRAELQEQARGLGLDEHVRFLGFRTDVAALLQACDVFVLPSRYEAMSVAVLEALAAGLPCVVTDVGDNRYLVQHEVSGLIVPPGQPAALTSALAALIEDPARARSMGAAARERATTFDIDLAVRRVHRLYAEALAGRSARASRRTAGQKCPG